MNKIIHLSLACVMAAFCCCNRNVSKQKLSTLDSMQKAWKGRKISLDSLEQFSNKEGTDFNKLLTSGFKVVTYLDANCSVCLTELEEWKKFIDRYEKRGPIPLIFVLAGPDKKYLKYILNQGKFDYNVLFDRKGTFYKENQIPIEKSFQAMILTDNNIVEVIGSPIFGGQLENLYIRKLDSLNKNPKGKLTIANR